MARAQATGTPDGEFPSFEPVEPRSTLVAYGAPLFWKPLREMPLEEAVARGLRLVIEDPALLLSLPVVLARNHDQLDSEALIGAARRFGVEAELGMLLSLTAELSRNPTFRTWAERCTKPRPGNPRYLVPTLSSFRVAAAERNTPAVVAEWGFRVNLPDTSFRQFFEKHWRARG